MRSTAFAQFRSGPLRAFKSEADAVRAGAWFAAEFLGNQKARAFCEKANIELRALSTGINSAGGVLVPVELMRTIIELRERRGAFRAAAHIHPMGSDTAQVPRRLTGITAYFPAEGQAPAASDLSVDAFGLTAEKIAAISTISNELDEDAAADIGDLIAREMAYAFADKEDRCGFYGDGTSTYAGMTGIITKLLTGTMAGAITAASGHDTWAEIDAADLSLLVGALPDYAVPGARWFMSQKAFALVFFRLAAVSGSPILMMPDANGRICPHFMGFPVTTSSILPQVGVSADQSGAAMILFGDLELAATLGERRGVTIASTDLSPAVFAADQTAFKGTERVHIVAHDVGDATNPGPIVALIGE